MAKNVSPAEVEEMVRLYKVYGTYAAVAKVMGRSASTVSRHLNQKITKSMKIAINNNI